MDVDDPGGRAADRPARRELRPRIARAALHLCTERGFDGFTMDDLAERVGVSRRTLFNHVPSKIEAVLGAPPVLTGPAVAEFVAGGPHGVLLLDLGEVLVKVTTPSDDDPDEWRLRRAVLKDPRIHRDVLERVHATSSDVIGLIQQRDDSRFDESSGRLALGILLAAFDAAVTDYIDGRADDVARRFLTLLSQVRDLAT